MRNRVLGTNMLATVATVLLIVGTAIGRQVPNADSTNPAKRFRWPNGRRAAVSLSFDDARVSQIDTGLALLKRQLVKVTLTSCRFKRARPVSIWLTRASSKLRLTAARLPFGQRNLFAGLVESALGTCRPIAVPTISSTVATVASMFVPNTLFRIQPSNVSDTAANISCYSMTRGK